MLLTTPLKECFSYKLYHKLCHNSSFFAVAKIPKDIFLNSKSLTQEFKKAGLGATQNQNYAFVRKALIYACIYTCNLAVILIFVSIH